MSRHALSNFAFKPEVGDLIHRGSPLVAILITKFSENDGIETKKIAVNSFFMQYPLPCRFWGKYSIFYLEKFLKKINTDISKL